MLADKSTDTSCGSSPQGIICKKRIGRVVYGGKLETYLI